MPLTTLFQVRQDEISELEFHRSLCRLPVGGGVESSYGKVNILLQTYISRGKVNSFSLTSDLSYVAQVERWCENNNLFNSVLLLFSELGENPEESV